MQPVGENVRKNGKGSEWCSKHFYRLSYGFYMVAIRYGIPGAFTTALSWMMN